MADGMVISAPLQSIGSPLLWTVTVVVLLALLAVDFVITRRPHEVPMREAVGWSAFLASLRHLNHGLGIILAFIAVKLILHWAHGIWTRVPEVPTPLSLGVIIATLATVTATSMRANRRDARTRARQPSTSTRPSQHRIGVRR